MPLPELLKSRRAKIVLALLIVAVVVVAWLVWRELAKSARIAACMNDNRTRLDDVLSQKLEGFGGAGGLQTLAEQGYFQGSGHEGYSARKLEGFGGAGGLQTLAEQGYFQGSGHEGYSARRLEGMSVDDQLAAQLSGCPMPMDSPCEGYSLPSSSLSKREGLTLDQKLAQQLEGYSLPSSSLSKREGMGAGGPVTFDQPLLGHNLPYDGYAARRVEPRPVQGYSARRLDGTSALDAQAKCCVASLDVSRGSQNRLDKNMGSTLRSFITGVTKSEGFTENSPCDVACGTDHSMNEGPGGQWGSPKKSEGLSGMDLALRDIAMN